MEVDNLGCYCLLLKQENGAVLCNCIFTAVAMQDFDEDKSSLKVLLWIKLNKTRKNCSEERDAIFLWVQLGLLVFLFF